VVFHLLPKGQAIHDERDTRALPTSNQVIATVPFERINAESYVVSPSSEEITAEPGLAAAPLTASKPFRGDLENT